MPRFSPALQLELIETHRATISCGVPTMLRALLGHPDLAKRDVSSLRRALAGGAVSPPALVEEVEATLGVTYSIAFAQTEASCSVTLTTAADASRALMVGGASFPVGNAVWITLAWALGMSVVLAPLGLRAYNRHV